MKPQAKAYRVLKISKSDGEIRYISAHQTIEGARYHKRVELGFYPNRKYFTYIVQAYQPGCYVQKSVWENRLAEYAKTDEILRQASVQV